MENSTQRTNHFNRHNNLLRAGNRRFQKVKLPGTPLLERMGEYLNQLSGKDSFFKDPKQRNTRYLFLALSPLVVAEYINKLGDNYLMVYEKTNYKLETALSTGMVLPETDIILHTNLLSYFSDNSNTTLDVTNTPDAHTLAGWLATDVKMLFRSDLTQDKPKYSLNLFGIIPNNAETIYIRDFAVFNNTNEETAFMQTLHGIFITASEQKSEVIIFTGVLSKYPIDAAIYYINEMARDYKNIKHIIFIDAAKYSVVQTDKLAMLCQDN